MKEFDKELIYDQQITPLMDKIINICKEYELPMIASFCYKMSEETGEDVCTTYLLGNEGWMPEAFKDCKVRLFRKDVIVSITITRGK